MADSRTGAGERPGGLYPTKTRMALLADVAAGYCHREPAGVDYNSAGQRKVTAALAELERAGWVRLPEQPPQGRVFRVWTLTDAGKALLAALEEGRGA